MDLFTADLCDVHGEHVRVVEPMFSRFGGRAAFFGRIATLKLFEDNSLVRKMLESAGHERVLVIDGGGSLRRALIGDELASLGVKNGWSGIVVYGCIRDCRAIAAMDIGILAIDSHPMKTMKKNVGEADVAVTFGGVTFIPGEWLYADEDGVIVSATGLHKPSLI